MNKKKLDYKDRSRTKKYVHTCLSEKQWNEMKCKQRKKVHDSSFFLVCYDSIYVCTLLQRSFFVIFRPDSNSLVLIVMTWWHSIILQHEILEIKILYFLSKKQNGNTVVPIQCIRWILWDYYQDQTFFNLPKVSKTIVRTYINYKLNLFVRMFTFTPKRPIQFLIHYSTIWFHFYKTLLLQKRVVMQFRLMIA